MKEQLEKMELGRIAFRVEGSWWVAYYALPNTMEGAHELARIHIAMVRGSKRKEEFMELVRSYIKEIIPAFETADPRKAPEGERSGHA